MGWGDNIMASGMARGAAARGKRIAFGDGNRIIWDKHSPMIFEGNPNIAVPGDEGASDLEWNYFYKGRRNYNYQVNNRWVWNYGFRAVPGEMFFTDQERTDARRYGNGFVLIEPNVPAWKSVAPNKDWGRGNYQKIAHVLRGQGLRLVQLVYGRDPVLAGVVAAPTKSFRDALAIMENAALYIGPEGGLHHGAAAVDVPGVVIFGGFIPPQVTGYDTHTNLTGGAEACGSLSACAHCVAAMAAISVDEVASAALGYLKRAA